MNRKSSFPGELAQRRIWVSREALPSVMTHLRPIKRSTYASFLPERRILSGASSNNMVWTTNADKYFS